MEGESRLHPGSLPACFAGSLLLFLETSLSLSFGASNLALASPEFSGFYLNHKVLQYCINQVVFSPMTRVFLIPLSFPRELMTMVPQTYGSQGG